MTVAQALKQKNKLVVELKKQYEIAKIIYLGYDMNKPGRGGQAVQTNRATVNMKVMVRIRARNQECRNDVLHEGQILKLT